MSNSESVGVLEILGNGAAFIRRKETSYTPGKRDVYVGPKLVRKYHLRTGDEIVGTVRHGRHLARHGHRRQAGPHRGGRGSLNRLNAAGRLCIEPFGCGWVSKTRPSGVTP